jgi:Fe-S-cluster containining protein
MDDRFSCTRCGGCCKSLLTTVDGKLLGLYLDPSEIKSFPQDVIFPLVGHGKLPTITAYQLGVNRCPNFVEENGVGKCSIHTTRPRICRAFPVISRYKVAESCAGIARLKNGATRESLKGEIAAHEEKLDYAMTVPTNEWIWPLNKKEWVRIEEKIDDRN